MGGAGGQGSGRRAGLGVRGGSWCQSDSGVKSVQPFFGLCFRGDKGVIPISIDKAWLGLFSASFWYVCLMSEGLTSFQFANYEHSFIYILPSIPSQAKGLMLTELLTAGGRVYGGRACFGVQSRWSHETSTSVSRCWGIVPAKMAGWPAAFPHRVST